MFRVLTVIALFASTAAEFLTDPQSVTVHEGQDITLSCRSSLYDIGQSCTTYSFYWIIHNRFLTDTYLNDYCFTVYDKFSNRMTISKNDGDFSLTIRQVNLDDSGNYYCYVSGTRSFGSTWANLVVLREPPSCDVIPSFPTVGTSAQLRCQLSERDPASLLTWIDADSGTVVDSGSAEPTDPRSLNIADILVGELDNYREFACVAGPDLVNGARCVITPLQVQTIVLISPSLTVTVLEGQVASFTCTSESISSADEFRWRVIKSDGQEDKVNMNTISNLGDDYTLSGKGQELGIVRVSIDEFNNSAIRCISVIERETVSSTETALFVLPASETGTTHQPTTETDPLGPDPRDDPDSSTGIVVGGVIGVVLLLAIIASLACYLLRNKNGTLRQRLARSRFHILSSANTRPTMSVVQACPTYEEVPQDTVRYQTRRSSDVVVEQPALYALPEAAIKHIPGTSGNSSPTYANSSGYVNLPRHGEQRPLSGTTGGDNKRIVSSGEVKYSVLDKSRRTAPPAGETTEGALQPKDDPKQKNAEGLVYAELDLEDPRPASSLENGQCADESINYASIRGDMAAVRSLLSRE